MSIYDDYNSWVASGSQTQGQWMPFEQWMTEQGYRLGGEDNDQWYSEDSEGGSKVVQEELERLQSQYSGWLFANESGDWGSAGMPIGDSGDFFDPNKTQNAVTIDGKQYVQMGTGSMADIEASGYADQVAGILQPMKDPTYGWVVPLDKYIEVGKVAGQYNIANEGWTAFIPQILLALGAAGVGAASSMGASILGGAEGVAAAGAGELAATSGLAEELAVAGTGLTEAEGLASLGLSGEVVALPESYWSALAEGGATATDAATAGAGTVSSEFATGAELVANQAELDAFMANLQTSMANPVTNTGELLFPNSVISMGSTSPNLLQTLAQTPTPPTSTSSTSTTPTLGQLGTAASVAGTGATLAGLGGDEGELAPTGAELLGEAPPEFNMTPEQWAESIGATLNPDGTINWESVDLTDTIKSLGYIDSGAFDDGSGASKSLSEILSAINTATGVAKTAGQLSDEQYQNQDNESGSRTEENILKGLTPTVPDPTGLLSRILNGTATADDLAKLAGILGSTGLGVLGANKQADAFKEASDKYFGLGAPYRDRLNASYGTGFDLTKEDPQFKNALNTSADTVLRRLSANEGNPFDNPGGTAEAMRYVTGSTYLPQLNTYRSQLGSFGGLGVNTAGTMDATKASTSGGLYDALGYGLGQLTGSGTNTTLDQLLKKMSGTSGYGLNTGGLF